MKMDHINISAPMPLLEQVRDFYCTVFAMEDGFRPSFNHRGFWLYSGNKPLVHLVESDQYHANQKQGYLDHIAFQLSDAESVVARLQSLDIQYRVSHLPEINLTQVFFNDPAGIKIEANFPGECL
jgi:catechol 2,3-dioxygenase-like lactoylglutathione lyase family enzyme